ncbi:MAG: hypothetical protein WDN29_12360 [Methylovirgula sp.]
MLKAGGIVVNFNPLQVEREIARQIEDSGTTIMVTLDVAKIYPKIAEALDTTSLERVVICSLCAALPKGKGTALPPLQDQRACQDSAQRETRSLQTLTHRPHADDASDH